MDSLCAQSQKSRLRELLARLDRIATVSRGHRAGLHQYDPALFDQYIRVLVAWESGQDLSTPWPQRTFEQELAQVRSLQTARQ